MNLVSDFHFIHSLSYGVALDKLKLTGPSCPLGRKEVVIVHLSLDMRGEKTTHTASPLGIQRIFRDTVTIWCLIINPYFGTQKCYVGLSTTSPRWHSGKEPICQWRRRRRHGFDPWIGKIPWSRKWQHNQCSWGWACTQSLVS